MKNIVFLALLLFTVFFSCSRKEESSVLLPELQQAEAIMYAHPDSALKILERMAAPAASDHLQNATWCLLMTQAKYKNYIKQPSDSLIDIAYDYFIKQDDPQRKALVSYYKGVLYDEKDETEKALQYYLEAANYIGNATDYQLGYLIHVKIGHIYALRSLLDYSMKACIEANRYAELSENKTYISASLIYIARVYELDKKYDESIQYYNKVLKLASDIGDFKDLTGALTGLSGIYYELGNYLLAIKYAKESVSVNEKEQIGSEQEFMLIGNAFKILERSDSAYCYLTKALSSDNIRTTANVYQSLYNLAKENGQYKEAINYGDKFIFYLDSIRKTERSQALVEMQKKYKEEKLINEKNQLKIEKDQSIRMALYISMALFGIIAVLVFIYQRILLKRAVTIRRNEEQIRIYALRIHENESLMARNENRIKELTFEIEQNQEIYEQNEEQERALAEIKRQNDELRGENKILQTSISQYSTSLQEKAKLLDSVKSLSEENSRLRDRESFLCNQLIKKTNILSKLKQSPKYLEPDHWVSVREAIDFLYDNFTVRLSKQIPALTEGEMKLCCLIKLHLTVSEMADLLAISPSSVSKNKQRLKDRIIQGLGTPFGENQTIDLWLWEY